MKIKVFNLSAFFISVHSFNHMDCSSQPRFKWTGFLPGPSHQFTLFYKRIVTYFMTWEKKVITFVLLNQNLCYLLVWLYCFLDNILLLWEEIKLEAVSVVKKGRLIPPDVKSPRNGNKTNSIATKIRVIREVKGKINIKKVIIERS